MKTISKIEDVLSAILFLLGIGISLYGIFVRYVIGESQSWTTEIYTMMLVWAIFIGFATALRDDQHIKIDILQDRMGPGLKKISEIITFVVGIGFSIFFIWTGTNMVLTAFEQGIKTIDVGFPIWINYLIMPIGGLLLFVTFIDKAYKFFVSKRQKNEKGDPE